MVHWLLAEHVTEAACGFPEWVTKQKPPDWSPSNQRGFGPLILSPWEKEKHACSVHVPATNCMVILVLRTRRRTLRIENRKTALGH